MSPHTHKSLKKGIHALSVCLFALTMSAQSPTTPSPTDSPPPVKPAQEPVKNAAAAEPAPRTQTDTRATKPAPDDDIVLMDAFVVSDKDDGSYVSSESVTGSRVKTVTKDLPYMVTTITSEFLFDFGIEDIGSNFAYTSSFSSFDQSTGSYVSRGFPASKLLRNGFKRLGLVDRSNVDRIEIIKGPAAAIYGETAPGGLMNVITKSPKKRAEYSANLSFGPRNSTRVDLSATGPIYKGSNGSGVYYRIDYGHFGTDYALPLTWTNQNVFSGVVKWDINRQTSLKFESEYIKRAQNNQIGMPFINIPDDRTADGGDTYRPGLATHLRDLNISGPNNWLNEEMTTNIVTLEHQFTKMLTGRVSASWYDRTQFNLGTGGNDYFASDQLELAMKNQNPLELLTPEAYPEGVVRMWGGASKNHRQQTGGGLQADMLVRYFFGKHIENRTLVTIDYSDSKNNQEGYGIPNEWITDPMRFVNVANPQTSYDEIPDYNSSVFGKVNALVDNRVQTVGAFLRHQMAFWQGKLIVVGGLRYDEIIYDLQDYRVRTRIYYKVKATSPQVGANYKLTDNHTIYANYVNSFSSEDTFVSVTNILPNETAYSTEAGLKSEFFKKKLSFTLGFYEIHKENVKITNSDYNEAQDQFIRYVDASGTARARGVDFDYNYKLTDALQLLGGIGYVDSRYLNRGIDVDGTNRQLARVPYVTGGTVVRYNFRKTFLKGLGLSLGFRYNSGAAVGDGGGKKVTPDTVKDPAQTGNNGEREIFIPSTCLWNLGVSYSFDHNIGRRSMKHSLNVNINNLFDKEYLEWNRTYGDPKSISIGYRIEFK